jgi:hypothetical protein
MTRFHYEPDPSYKGRWRVVRVDEDGTCTILQSHFRKQSTAAAFAIKLEIQVEQSARRIRYPYLGD